jgi:hypothetical protein
MDVPLGVNVVMLCRLFAGPPAAEPRAVVEELVADSGFVPTYVGPIRYARNLEVRNCAKCCYPASSCIWLPAQLTCWLPDVAASSGMPLWPARRLSCIVTTVTFCTRRLSRALHACWFGWGYDCFCQACTHANGFWWGCSCSTSFVC